MSPKTQKNTKTIIVGEGRGGEHGGAQRERACGAGKGAGVLWHSHLLRNSASIQCD